MVRPWMLAPLAALTIVTVNGVQAPNDPIRVERGLISGTQGTDASIQVFKGIPFAAAPVGPRRWMPPQAVIPWSGVRRTDTFSPMCMQPQRPPQGSNLHDGTPEAISEDCLYLNVWTPVTGTLAASTKRPVLVWIYGGLFRVGSAATGLFHGEALARKGVVFVSLNYRVGPFGYLAHPDLARESGHGASGNYALLDQIAALKWVRANIAAFGGDPDRVTVVGQSAGSMSISALMASPVAKGLFQRAIGESGAQFGPNDLRSRSEAEQAGTAFAAAMGARSIADLRATTAEQILNGAWQAHGTVVDGWVLPEAIYTTFANGQQNDVPLLTGWTANDTGRATSLNASDFIRQTHDTRGGDADALLKIYPASSDQEARQSQVAVVTDRMFGWNAWTWARMQSHTGKSASYLYYFTHIPPHPDAANQGAFHGADIYYALGNLGYKPWAWTPPDRALANTMMSYWINFATMGDPNGAGLPAWPAYSEKADTVMLLGDPVKAAPNPRKLGLAFVEAANAAQRVR
jgi:para-nitrobenzyl esterase